MKYANLFAEFQAAVDEFGIKQKDFVLAYRDGIRGPDLEKSRDDVLATKVKLCRLYNDILTDLQFREENRKTVDQIRGE